jgi:predicted dehydrogenase
VDNERLTAQVDEFKKQFPEQTQQMKAYKDFRKLLENKDIDGIIITTPDHWHAYVFAEALKAGKAVYVEKPVANSIAECNKMLELQAKYKTVISTGLWQTSQRYYLMCNEILKTGVLGDVYKVQVFLSENAGAGRVVADEAAPPHLDYEMWLGPAPARPYNSARVRGWRGYWDYGGGVQTDWGVHTIDSAFDGLKALGLSDRIFPKSVFSVAHRNPKNMRETPSCQTTIWQYDNFHIEWALQVAHLYNRWQGVVFIGSKATLVCHREGYKLIPEGGRDGKAPVTDAAEYVGKTEDMGVEDHTENWLKCIREKNLQTNSPVEKGAFATIMCHLANISYHTGSQVIYDPKTQKMENNPAADAFLKPAMRKPWDSLWNF